MERQVELPEDEINLLDLLIVLAKRKKLIIGITFGGAMIAAIASLLMTPIYKAETKILPPQQGSSSMTSQLLGQLGGFAGLAGGSLGKTSNDLYLALLKSRPILDNMIDKLKLMEFYEVKSREDARKVLVSALKTQDDKKSGIVSIGVEGKDPKMAADIANAFVDELRAYNKRLALTEASQRRLFFEEQLKDAKEALIKSEEAMQGFQEKTGALKIDDQARAVIEGIAQLRAQIAAKEIELRVMRSFATPQNPDLQRVEAELGGLKVEMAKLEARGGSGYDPLMPTGRMPQVGTDFIRRMRDLKYNETLYEIMAKQYEMAKLDEAKDAVIIQVIEKAIPPEKRIKPKRSQMVMIATFAGFFISVFVTFLMEYVGRSAQDPETKIRLETLRRHAGLGSKG